ncbi:MAG: ACP S-malonyltransferase [Candidatus Aminicenantes bacterium]|jgi:[acyl-carrier-protein] S-malonyltransferase
MTRTAFLFPGVGSQHAGMGEDFYRNFKIVRDTFEEANDVLGMDLVKICFSDNGKAKLSQLEISQCALLTLSVATFRFYMEEVELPPLYCMGHSLGEYSALCCTGVIQFPDALSIVKQRGNILKEVAQTLDGLMAWVINLDNKIVEKICSESLKQDQEIYVSAYDAPKQSSISGSKDVVIKTGRKLEKEGAIVYPLKLSGPFHSPFMKPAAEQLRSILTQYEFDSPLCPVIANHCALLYQDKENVVDNLSMQLIRPVCWQSSVDYLLEQEIRLAIEMGPDRVLKHLMQSNTDLIDTISLRDMNDLEMVKERLDG